MNHDQFLANNDHSSPCILQNHPALWQLNPSLWPELLKRAGTGESWFPGKPKSQRDGCIASLVLCQEKVRWSLTLSTEFSFYLGLWKEHRWGRCYTDNTDHCRGWRAALPKDSANTQRGRETNSYQQIICVRVTGVFGDLLTPWWTRCGQQRIWKQSVCSFVSSCWASQETAQPHSDGGRCFWPVCPVFHALRLWWWQIWEKSARDGLQNTETVTLRFPLKFILHLGGGILQIIPP